MVQFRFLASRADSILHYTGKKLALVFTAMLLSILLIALDQTILATALPRVSTNYTPELLKEQN